MRNNICQWCGAHLDPCEKCDCRQGMEKAASEKKIRKRHVEAAGGDAA